MWICSDEATAVAQKSSNAHKAVRTAMEGLTPKLITAVWRLTQNCNIVCSRPAMC